MRTLRTLVVDDSAYNRRVIGDLLSEIDGVEVVGKATDGDEALRAVEELSPDFITLDLEMPRMDGFTFLRLLMARKPLPVIVVSGYSAKENVFRALELGAIDFVAKPSRSVTSDLVGIAEQLKEKVEMVRQLTPASLDPTRTSLRSGRTATAMFQLPGARGDEAASRARAKPTPQHVVVVGASTGGPTALLEMFNRFPSSAPAALIVAQHMPERFTRTFAERLDRLGSLTVREATHNALIGTGEGWICPGGQCVEIVRSSDGPVMKVVSPRAEDRYVPSVDRLFETAAKAYGSRVIAVVLTGMGDDGARGAAAVHAAGGMVLAEAPETAVIYGMPGAAVRTGAVERSLPLRALAEHVATLVTKGQT
ncbi:MAG: chemotaxis response regulator protein-glutamate methylesterase [Deltaproteobacteria bacterium]|nr:MAG: chemotaxis response regulator protein-glutamate methylesterase [Deltaproteobacteria bacterium]